MILLDPPVLHFRRPRSSVYRTISIQPRVSVLSKYDGFSQIRAVKQAYIERIREGVLLKLAISCAKCLVRHRKRLVYRTRRCTHLVNLQQLFTTYTTSCNWRSPSISYSSAKFPNASAASPCSPLTSSFNFIGFLNLLLLLHSVGDWGPFRIRLLISVAHIEVGFGVHFGSEFSARSSVELWSFLR